jgi:glycosyltransferase involved in cell wall biosynthesis
MPPLVGVYIPAYNAAPFVEKAIRSVLGQTFGDFELLVVDDASTDETQRVVAPYLSHPKVMYVRNEHNLGMSGNWNKGVSLLANKYVAKLDADDYHSPDFLENMVAALEADERVGLAFSGLNWVTHGGSRVELMLPYRSSWVADGRAFRANLFRKFMAYGPTICVRRECYSRLGGFVDAMRIHSDWEMWTRIASHYDVAYINKPLATVVRHPNNCTAMSRKDTRTPDDFELWLRLLDSGATPYRLDGEERQVLEAAMIRIVIPLLSKALGSQSFVTAAACVGFLLGRRLVPAFEKVRFRVMLELLNRHPRHASLTLAGMRWTRKLWPLAPWLSINMPARDPYEALAKTS